MSQPQVSAKPRWPKWLILRRLSQLIVFSTFAIGPWCGWWLIKGNLSASIILDTVPLSDPLVSLQTLMAGHWAPSLLLGAGIIAGFYGVLGGRSFCSWVCPVNLVTDLAAYLRLRWRLPKTTKLDRRLKYYLLALVLGLPLLTRMLAWEWLNPVPLLYRALLFGGVSCLWLLALIFMVDLFISERAWCGHLCPTGALYSLLGKLSVVRMASKPKACDMCMDCFDVCPEPQVLKPALKGETIKITSSDCSLCGRCIDVCHQQVFHYRLQCNTPKNGKALTSNQVNTTAEKAEITP
ncbi:MAG: quinol dehydrogenase ferredoxin subunit NapH [Shewanella sp.]